MWLYFFQAARPGIWGSVLTGGQGQSSQLFVSSHRRGAFNISEARAEVFFFLLLLRYPCFQRRPQARRGVGAFRELVVFQP